MTVTDQYTDLFRTGKNELPTYDELARILFAPPRPTSPHPPLKAQRNAQWAPPERDGQIRVDVIKNSLRSALNEYHTIPPIRETLQRKVTKLEYLSQLLPYLIDQKPVGQASLVAFTEHVKIRHDYFKTLLSYIDKKSDKIDDLFALFRNKESREIPKVKDQETQMYISLHWTQLLEKLDPYRRMKLNSKILNLYKTWVVNNWEDNLKPSENLVDFLLKQDGVYSEPVRYFSEEETRLSKLIFKSPDEASARKGKVYAYYVRDNGKILPCSSDRLNQGLLPQEKVFHTMGGDVSADGEALNYGQLRTIRGDGVDLFGAQLYVMRDNVFYSYPVKGAKHSQALSGKAVQSAGLIVGKEGKILAIDNKSGHYRPTWKHLEQAVKFIAKKSCFDKDACVGISHGEGCVFLTVDDFLQLAPRNFPFRETWAAINWGHKIVFELTVFKDIRRYYEASGNWDWTDAKQKFLEMLYPEIAHIEYLKDRQRSWDFSEFKKESKLVFNFGRGGLNTADQMLKNYDAAYNRVFLAWEGWDAYDKDGQAFVSAIDELHVAFFSLLRAVTEWVNKHLDKHNDKRWNAATNLLQQLNQDGQKINSIRGLEAKSARS